MSTRCNVVIISCKRTLKTACQIYRHSDGYPECTGKDLQDYINQLMQCDENDIKNVMESPQAFAEFISGSDDRFRIQGQLDLTTDIEYLYVIDMSAKTVTCYEVQMPAFWAGQIISNDKDFVQGKANKKYINRFGSKCEESKFVYKMDFTDNFDYTYKK